MPNKLNITKQGLSTSGENIRSKRAIPALAIIQGVAAIGRMMIKGINALVDAKRASSFNNDIKLVNENVQITHDRLITLENRTAMMAKAIMLDSRPDKGLLAWVPIPLGSTNIIVFFSLVFSVITRCHYLLEPIALIPLYRNGFQFFWAIMTQWRCHSVQPSACGGSNLCPHYPFIPSQDTDKL